MKKLLFGIIFFALSSSNAEKINLGNIDYKVIKKQYKGFEKSFDEAFIGIPAKLLGIDKPFYSSLLEVKSKYSEIIGKTND